MVEVNIPTELATYWKQVVKERFGGDEELAAQEAVVRLIEREKHEIVDEEKFNLAVKSLRERKEKAEEISDEGFSSALAKRKRRMERARELFGQIGKDDEA